MSVTITSYAPAYAGGTVTTGTLVLNAPNQGVNGQLAMLFMNPDEMLIGTGVNMFSVETMGDILDGTFGSGYSYNDLLAPTASLDINSQALINVLDPTNLQDAATKNYVDVQVGLIGGPFLPLAGGTMTGNINTGGGANRITFDTDLDTFIHSPFDDYLEFVVNSTTAMMILNGPTAEVGFYNNQLIDVADPTAAQHAATKNYVDTQLGGLGPFLPLSGAAAMTGDLDMGTNNISNVANVDGRDVSADGGVLDAHVGDLTLHRTINDAGALTTDLWSADKIITELALKLDSATAATTYLALAGGTMAGAIAMGTNGITGMADPTLAQDAATKAYVDGEITALGLVGVGPYLPLAGGTMTGTLVLAADPTSALQAATKQYVDTEITGIGAGGFLKIDGTSTMTGNLNMGTNQIVGVVDPTLAQDAATKNYVDTEITALGLTGTGPYLKLDGTTPMTAALDFGTNKGINLVDPTLAQDAATKNYVDTEITSLSLGGTGPFLQLAGGTMTGDIDMNGNDILNAGLMDIGSHWFQATQYTSGLGGNAFLIRLTATPAVGTPTYSFATDTDTGILNDGADAIIMACGGAAELTVNPTEIDAHSKKVVNLVDPTNPADAATKGYVDGINSVRLLAKSTGVDLTATGVTNLYTVPTGKLHIITEVIVRLTSFVPGGAPTSPEFNVGTVGAFDNIVDGFQMQLTAANAADQAWYLSSDVPLVGVTWKQGAVTPNAGTIVKFNVTTAAGGTVSAAVADVYVLGFEA